MSTEDSAKPEVEAEVRVEAEVVASATRLESEGNAAMEQTIKYCNPNEEIMIAFGPGSDPVKID